MCKYVLVLYMDGGGNQICSSSQDYFGLTGDKSIKNKIAIRRSERKLFLKAILIMMEKQNQ